MVIQFDYNWGVGIGVLIEGVITEKQKKTAKRLTLGIIIEIYTHVWTHPQERMTECVSGGGGEMVGLAPESRNLVQPQQCKQRHWFQCFQPPHPPPSPLPPFPAAAPTPIVSRTNWCSGTHPLHPSSFLLIPTGTAYVVSLCLLVCASLVQMALHTAR